MSEEFTPQQLLAPVVKAIDTKHGKDIEVLDIHDISTLGDYFVIATGSSPAQIKAMSDELENVLTKLGIEPKKYIWQGYLPVGAAGLYRYYNTSFLWRRTSFL